MTVWVVTHGLLWGYDGEIVFSSLNNAIKYIDSLGGYKPDEHFYNFYVNEEKQYYYDVKEVEVDAKLSEMSNSRP